MELKRKRITIVGGSSGIGLGVAKAAVAKGAHVTIASRSKDKLKKAAEKIGSNVEVRVLDVTKEEDVKAFFDVSGTFDHLVTTTHAIEPVRGFARPVSEIETDAARAWMDSKFWGQYFCAKYGEPKLSQTGSITLTGGAASRSYVTGHATIAATNAAVGAFGWLFALEIAPKRVNTVVPGLVKTPAFDFLSDEERKDFYGLYDKITPVKHVATPDEIAVTYIYLMESDFHNADVLVVDGGLQGEELPIN